MRADDQYAVVAFSDAPVQIDVHVITLDRAALERAAPAVAAIAEAEGLAALADSVRRRLYRPADEEG